MGCVPDSLAGQIVANQPDPNAAAVMLRDRAFASGSTDNISVLCVKLNSTAEERKAFLEKKASPAKPKDRAPENADFGSFDV